MRRSRRVALVALAACLVTGGAVRGGPPDEPPPWRWWANPTITGEIGLTPRQAEAIARAHAESRLELVATAGLLRERRTRLGELLGGERLDPAELDRVLGDISRLQMRQLRSVIHLRVRVRRLLVPDQLARLLALHPALMRRPWERPAPRIFGAPAPGGRVP